MINVAEASPEAWDQAMAYYSSGYRQGLERGRELADAEASQLWREAGKVVRGLAGRDALPNTEWMQHASSERLTAAAERRKTDDVTRFRASYERDRAAYLAGQGSVPRG